MSSEVARELSPAIKIVYFILAMGFGFFMVSEFFVYAVERISYWLGFSADLMQIHVLVFIFAVGFAYLLLMKFASSFKVILTGTVIGIIARFLFDVICEYQGYSVNLEFWNIIGVAI